MMRLDADLDPVGQPDIMTIRNLRQQRVREINTILDALEPQCGTRSIHRYASAGSEGKAPAETVCFQLPNAFGSFGVGVIVEINTEHTAFSFRAWPLPCETDRDDIAAEARSALRNVMSGDLSDDDIADPAIDQLFGAFWNAFFKLQAKRIHPDFEYQNDAQARNQIFGNLGERFAEFHGLVLRTKQDFDTQVQAAHASRQPQKEYPADGPPLIVPTPKEAMVEITAFVNDRKNFFSRLLGFRKERSSPDFKEGNSVLCSMFDGFAAYGSTLGGDSPERVRYFVIYGGPSRHQLGRLLMMIHHCGETRLAAMFDRDLVREASTLISALDSRLNRARAATMRRISELLAEIAAKGRGGLDYRVARTKYHLETLRGMLRELRVSRIDGWQSYDGFIRRNVIRRISNAVGVGGRYESLQRRIRQIDFTATTQHLATQQSHLVQLQRIAEIFALGAFTYYIGSILGYALNASDYGARIAVFAPCGMLGIDCRDPQRLREAIHLAGFGFGFLTALALRYFFPLTQAFSSAVRQWTDRVPRTAKKPRFVGILGFL